ncbi:hypothetical protein F6R98_09620 [Candidatus Methylospira mobilis]|uniref:Rap1a immunity protein domain-containing protein n=1 Tax=Candidatus Methylospira mobilis TaxID=1808979 RepID=A0A5Q0BI94_9GAMM|nr:Rap1a/Tai family immunity protein [Candidatus Methylospira mobilis]QFY42842.1 hypothetical protein F6R98_09620 [Candidatus Methylospira mobilis]
MPQQINMKRPLALGKVFLTAAGMASICMISFSNTAHAVNGITLKSKCQYLHSQNQPEDLGSTPEYNIGLCTGYIMGTAAALKLPCSQTEAPSEVSEEVLSYLDRHAERLTQHAGSLIMEALKDSPLCKPATPQLRSRPTKKH